MKTTKLYERMGKQGIGSARELARRLLHRRPKLSGLPKQDCLATYLGNLARGQDSWFRHRPEILRALAEELDTSNDELLKPTERAPAVYQFRDFPQLPALNLREEAPCHLLAPTEDLEGMFGIAPLPETHEPRPNELPLSATAMLKMRRYSNLWRPRPHWIVARPGCGARLTARWLDAQQRGHCLKVRRLADASGALAHTGDLSRTFVLVSDYDLEGDAAAARSLASMPQLTVIAPYRVPRDDRPDTPVRDEDPDSASSVAGWTEVPWKLAADWRRRLLSWIARRLEQVDSSFDAEKLLAWLIDCDPQEQLCPSPGGVMPICALMHAHGPHWLRTQSPASLSRRLLEDLTERLPEGADGRLWLIGQAPTVLQALLRARLSQLGTPLRGGSSAEDWTNHLPLELLSTRMSEKEAEGELARLRRAKGKEQGKVEGQLFARMTTPDRLAAVVLLRQAGILRADPSGGLAAYPRWTQEHFLRDEALAELCRTSPAHWGRWASEPQRREVLDQALDRLDLPELMARIDESVAAFRLGCLGAVGAAESLFAAVGRRLQKGWQPTRQDIKTTLFPLWRCSEAARAPRTEHANPIRLPSTRIDGYWEQTDSFLADCWAWSFFLPSPPWPRSADAPWVWPGWEPVSSTDLVSIPIGALIPSLTWQQSGQIFSSADRLFALVDRFLGRCQDEAVPRHASTSFPFSVLVVLHAARHGWNMDRLPDYGFDDWQGKLLYSRAASLPEDARRRIAIWYAARFQRPHNTGLSLNLRTLRKNWPRMYRFLMDNLDWQIIEHRLKERSPHEIVLELDVLPEEPRQRLITYLVGRSDVVPDELVAHGGDTLGEVAAHVRIQLSLAIATHRSDYGWPLAHKLYELSLEHATLAAERAWRRDPAAASTGHWFVMAPKSMAVRSRFLDWLKELPPAQRPGWSRGFLAAMLHYAGEHSDDVFALMQDQS